MITGLLMRHYKNYGNVRFVPIMNDTNHMFTVYIGNNGVGKSAILEALRNLWKSIREKGK